MKELIVKERHHRGDDASFFAKEKADAVVDNARTHLENIKAQLSERLRAQHGIHDRVVFDLMSKSRERRLALVAARKIQEEARQDYTQHKNTEWLIALFPDIIGDMYYKAGSTLHDDATIIDIIFRHCEEWVATTKEVYKDQDTEEVKKDIESNVRAIIYCCLRGLPKSFQSIGAKGYDTKPGIEKVPRTYDLAEYVTSKKRV